MKPIETSSSSNQPYCNDADQPEVAIDEQSQLLGGEDWSLVHFLTDAESRQLDVAQPDRTSETFNSEGTRILRSVDAPMESVVCFSRTPGAQVVHTTTPKESLSSQTHQTIHSITNPTNFKYPLVNSKPTHDAMKQPGKYSGSVQNGLPHGHGCMVYDDGKILDGTWRHGYLHGEGKAYYKSGDVYVGTFARNRRHGQGLYLHKSGDSYKGTYQKDHRHGEGIFKCKTGEEYKGEFRAGAFHGYGTVMFPDGRREEGIYENWLYRGRSGKQPNTNN